MGWQGAYEGDGGPFVAVGGRMPSSWGDVRWMGDLLRLPPTATWPRIMSAPHPRAVNSLGREVVARIEARRESDPLTPRRAKRLRWWQKLIIYRMYEVDENGELCWRKVLVSTSRQVGKSVGLREIALDRMAAWDHFGEPQLILHVAKDLSIADEIQRPARQWANMVGDPWHGVGGNGRWAVEHTGMMGRWIVRSQTAVYGYSASAALIDEAWAIDVEHITEGIEPTMVEREQPQMLMISTAHREATSLFPDLRVPALRRLATPVDDVLLLEWSAPPGADPHHVAAHRMASPHWDERRAAFILSKVDQAGFQEQWLNVWPEVGGQVATLAPREIVDRCARTLEIAPTADGRTFVLYPTLDQTTWHVLTGARVGDEIQVKVDGSHRSLRKATEHVARMAAKGNPSDLLIPRHIRGRVPRLPGVRTTIQASDADLTAATTSVRPLLLDGRVVHDGPEALADQMVGAVLDEYGETVRISSKHSPGQVELAKAAMLAAWWASREDRPTAVIV